MDSIYRHIKRLFVVVQQLVTVERLPTLSLKVFLLLGLFSIGSSDLQGQELEHTRYRFENGSVFAVFDNIQDTSRLNELLETIGSSCEMTTQLQTENSKKTSLGWELVRFDQKEIEYKKTIDNLAAEGKGNLHFLNLLKIKDKEPYTLDSKFGVNDFKIQSVVKAEDSLFTFRLFDFAKAEKVFLAGTFNGWSTIITPMEKDGEVWNAKVDLEEGKHLYKFIVDGRWMTDPSNNQKEKDWHGNTNSVFYNYNYTFLLEDFQNANEVYLVGDFNNWRASHLKMKRNNNGWELPVYLEEGQHLYKFVVDGEWILDPANKKQLSDGKGNENSLLILGNQVLFETPNFENAEKVVLTGSFNGWDQASLQMEKTEKGWSLPVALRRGNYEYKYIVDGVWRIDSDNPHTIGKDKFLNSVYAVEPNHTFILKGYKKASKVVLTGTFNGWSHDGYTMERVGDHWEISIHLPKGKTRYKFIIDGKWKHDKENDLWESNQYDSKDSILWIE